MMGRAGGTVRAIAFAIGENGGQVIAAGRHQDALAAAYDGMEGDPEQAVTGEAAVAALASRITTVDDEIATASAPVAISPSIGPLPAVYVPEPGQAGGTGLLWRVTARFVRRAKRLGHVSPEAPAPAATWPVTAQEGGHTAQGGDRGLEGACDGR